MRHFKRPDSEQTRKRYKQIQVKILGCILELFILESNKRTRRHDTLADATVNNKHGEVVTKSFALPVVRNWSHCVYEAASLKINRGMDILSFSEEFSRLIIRYTKTNSPNEVGSRKAPLTKQEITNAVHNVIDAILGVDEPNIDIPLVETPDNRIMIVTPTAPIVPKIGQEQDDAENRFRLLDPQPIVQDSNLYSLDSPLQADRHKADGCLQVLQDGKKFISRSSPAICVTSVGRSDTFVREDKNAAKSVSQDDLDKVSGSAEVNDEFLFSLNEVRQSALSVVTKLDNLKKLAFPHSSLVRRLSGSLSGLNRTPCRMLAPTKIRRSNTALAGTPTSSKSLTTEREDLTDRRRSISGAAVLSSRKLNEATRGRSVSSSNLSVFNNTTGSFARPAKNPKYAHVQSTIPKPIATKRKA